MKQSREEEEALLKYLFGKFAAPDEQNVCTVALLECVFRKLGADEASIKELFSNASLKKDSSLSCADFIRILGSSEDAKPIPVGRLNFSCSLILRRDCERVARALESPQLALAVSLAPKMTNMTNDDVIRWATEQELSRIDTVSFFPISREQGVLPVTVCVVRPDSVQALRERGLELISKYGMTFLPLDIFSWAPASHSAFIEAKLFDKASEHLRTLGLTTYLMPMIMFKGKGLLLKYHMPQPELKEGTENPQACAHSVWTISTSDATPPEVLKIGMRGGIPLIVPWNPFATDVCIQESEETSFRRDWVQIKDADYRACHFVCQDG